MKTTLFLAFAFVWAAQSQETKGTATVQGEVLDSSGKALAGARVVVIASSADGVIQRAQSIGGTTDQDGRFSITGLNGGAYNVCASVPQSAYLNPCRWSKPPFVRVEAGKVSKFIKITLEQGVRMKLRLEDPNGTITPFKQTAGRFIIPSVRLTNGRSQSFELISSDVDAHDYEIAVPADVDLQVSFIGTNVKVADEKGTAIEQSKPVAVKSDAAASVQQLRFRLSAPPKQ